MKPVKHFHRSVALLIVIIVVQDASAHQDLQSAEPSNHLSKMGNSSDSPSMTVNRTPTAELQQEVTTVEVSSVSQPPPPTSCKSEKGCACVAAASGIDCVRRVDGLTCPNQGDYCCNMTKPEVPSCYSLNGTCLFNRSMIKCPLKLNAYCPDVSDYCCNMTLPPLPQCSKLNGTCLYKNSHIHCPSRLTAACPNVEDYCCNMTSPPPEEPKTCAERNGTCLYQNSTIHCPSHLTAACPNTEDYCCNMTLPPPEKPQTCAERNGACIGDTWPFFCESRINASCPKPRYYCCKSGEPAETTSVRSDSFNGGSNAIMRQEMPQCSEFDASCIGDTWPYFCPPWRRLNATCPQMFYCCGTNDSRPAGVPKAHEVVDVSSKLPKTTPKPEMPPCSYYDAKCIGSRHRCHPPDVPLHASCPQMFYCCGKHHSGSAYVSESTRDVSLEKDITKTSKCADLQGHCVPHSLEPHCPAESRLEATCPGSGNFCCKTDDIVSPHVAPKCSEVHGECVRNASAIHCPHALNATCPGTMYYCCNFTTQIDLTSKQKRERGKDIYNTEEQHQDELNEGLFEIERKEVEKFKGIAKIHTFTVKQKDLLPPCDSLHGGQCLFNNSRIYCPEKLDASCSSPNNYCCKLN